jgi:hypothetical protein
MERLAHNMTESPFSAVLHPGEQLLWSGQPKQGPRTLEWSQYLWGIAIVVPSALLSAFWQRRDWRPWVWHVVLMLAGTVIGVSVGRWLDARRRSRLYYAVTSERLIVAKGAAPEKMRVLPLYALLDAKVDGQHVTFNAGASVWTRLDSPEGVTVPGWPTSNCFAELEEPERVCEVIRRAMASQAQPLPE